MSECICRNSKLDHTKCGCKCEPEEPQFKVGDKVYSLLSGWTHVVGLDYKRKQVLVRAPISPEAYNFDGRYIDSGEIVLFHDKPTIIPAKKKVKKWRWVNQYKTDRDPWITNGFYSEEGIKKEVMINSERIKLPWTEIEVEENVIPTMEDRRD